MLRTTTRHRGGSAASLALLLLLSGCPDLEGVTTDGPATAGSDASTGSTPSTDDPTSTTQDDPTSTTAADETGEPVGTDDSGGTGPDLCQDPPPACDGAVKNCKEDQDHDGVAFACDNAPDVTNPDQSDLDGDLFGDAVDLCPTVPTDSNTADVDKDGVGDACDLCARQPQHYNKNADGVPAHMLVRNVPLQGDADHDGIGDACDNCVWVPNCQGFGDGDGLVPYQVGTPIDTLADDCQPDLDADLVGDACAGAMRPGAAGPVGFAAGDDFDQDGLTNDVDGCPRQPVAPQACASDGECPDGATCAAGGVCNHADRDKDGVGDICDTCPHAPNPKQVVAGFEQEDDPDGDFIGSVCEQSGECFERYDPRPIAFYDISVDGLCCVALQADSELLDPSGNPIDPGGLGPRPFGVFELPPGCEEALAASPDGKAHPLGACDVDALPELWDHLCLLPQRDQDVDGLGDACDLCVFAFDPNNEPFVDDAGMEWETFGKFCNGAFDPENLDPANMCRPSP